MRRSSIDLILARTLGRSTTGSPLEKAPWPTWLVLLRFLSRLRYRRKLLDGVGYEQRKARTSPIIPLDIFVYFAGDEAAIFFFEVTGLGAAARFPVAFLEVETPHLG